MVSAAERVSSHKWGMAVDVDRCTGCQACVMACQAENNVTLSTEDIYRQKRTFAWIRVERYWYGEFPDVKARFIPIMCQHCENAPCEPVCPVFATYHNTEGMNVQIYNRCVGTRYCGAGCPYNVRFFNYWEPVWPSTLRNQLNPDVTIRSRGIMEKCSFCVQRIRRGVREAARDGRELQDGDIETACTEACPTNALVFGDIREENNATNPSRAFRMISDKRAYTHLDNLNTEPNVFYLAQVDATGGANGGH
jgi:molybdopterin-containing oxidoreductase family iron-sulfur binding subunit